MHENDVPVTSGPNRRLARSRGCSSVVERQLPKLNVVGSIPIARSNPFPGLFLDAALRRTRRWPADYAQLVAEPKLARAVCV